MRARLTALLIVAALIGVAAPAYCFSLSQLLGSGEEPNLNTFKLIHVADLAALIGNASNKLHIYDANVDSVRHEFGIIPGVTLLNSDDNYALSVLPANKHAKLIFYCTNVH